jgi:hypothetical protein
MTNIGYENQIRRLVENWGRREMADGARASLLSSKVTANAREVSSGQ